MTRAVLHIAAYVYLCILAMLPGLGHAQYFGKNTVRWKTFDTKVLRTEHFDIYYYDEIAEHIDLIAQLAERWNSRLSMVLDHELTQRQPLILYASHPHFRQTNTAPADIGEGTGGFTEIFRNRVVMPFAGTLGETDHVLGHELVHAFQFNMTGRATDPDRFGNIPGAIRLPLWLVEGMAEYLSLGPHDSLSAMWLRDLVAREVTVDTRRLRHPRFQPYRHGHGLMAYIAGRFGDGAMGELLVEAAAANGNIGGAFEVALGINLEELLEDWDEALRAHYGPMLEHAQAAEDLGRVLRPGLDDDLPRFQLGPALSPDGRRLIYLAQPDRLSLELYLMDVETGEIIRRITRAALDPHFEALQFVRSSGDWSPDGERFVFAAIRRGQPVLEIVHGHTGGSIATHEFPALGEIFNAAWSPDGQRIAFSGMRHGLSDLYVFDLQTQELTRLTDDVHSALQPAWAPNGQHIAFVTDRFSVDPDRLAAHHHNLALIDPASGEITRLPQIPGARQVNPQWSSDGAAIYFLADARGTSNIYRLDLGNQGIYELSNVKTGVSGLTALSPALSVAGPRDTMALTLLDGGGFSLVLIDNGAAIEGTSVDQIAYPRELALLPPIERTGQMVTRFLGEPGALPPDPVVEVEDYAARIRPEFISQAMIGGGTGASGTFVAGGISMHWSDMLGHHNLLTQLQGQITDEEIVNNLAAVIAYQNRERRLNWGGSVSQIPFRSASFGQAMVDADGEPVLVQRAVRFWEINRTTSGRLAYPLSRASRVEFEGGFRHISYDAEEHVRAFSLQTGERLVNERDSISAPESLNLGTANAAFVHDTSLFGTTSPVLGQRSRLEVGGVTGDLTFFTPLVDYRAYWMPFERLPVTVAGRAMHFGRYGADAEDPRLRPLYLGSPTLVRGYETGFRVFADPVFDRLQGSRVAVANAEARAPLTGIRGFIGGPFVPPIDLALFYDAGVAWSSGERPEVIGGDRSGVTSYGASLRTNLGGIVLDFSYVNPRQRDDRGWHWQFTVTPGF